MAEPREFLPSRARFSLQSPKIRPGIQLGHPLPTLVPQPPVYSSSLSPHRVKAITVWNPRRQENDFAYGKNRLK